MIQTYFLNTLSTWHLFVPMASRRHSDDVCLSYGLVHVVVEGGPGTAQAPFRVRNKIWYTYPAPLNTYHQGCLCKTLVHATTENISKAQLPEQINLEDMIENIQEQSTIFRYPSTATAYSRLQPLIAGYWRRQAVVAGLVGNPNVNHQQKLKSKIGRRVALMNS